MYGRGGHPGHVTHMSRANFRSPYPWSLALIDRAVSEAKMFEIVDGRHTGHGYTLSSPGERAAQ